MKHRKLVATLAVAMLAACEHRDGADAELSSASTSQAVTPSEEAVVRQAAVATTQDALGVLH